MKLYPETKLSALEPKKVKALLQDIIMKLTKGIVEPVNE
jgi:hypothetical protein